MSRSKRARFDPTNKNLASRVLFDDEQVAGALHRINVFVVDHDPGNPRSSASMLPEKVTNPKDNPFRWIEYIHEEDRERVEKRWKQLFYGEIEEDVFRSEYRFKGPEHDDYRWISNVGTVIYRNEDGSCALYIGCDRDITEHKALEKALEIEKDRLSQLIIEDEFLRIPNRRYLATKQADFFDKHSLDGIAVMVFDIDHFKALNTKYTHKGGDTTLLLVVQEIKKHLRLSDTLARFGGDEFVIVLNRVTRRTALERAQNMLEAIHDMPTPWPELRVSISIGVHHGFPKGADKFWDYFDCADRALLTAKEAGRSQVKLYQHDTDIFK